MARKVKADQWDNWIPAIGETVIFLKGYNNGATDDTEIDIPLGMMGKAVSYDYSTDMVGLDFSNFDMFGNSMIVNVPRVYLASFQELYETGGDAYYNKYPYDTLRQSRVTSGYDGDRKFQIGDHVNYKNYSGMIESVDNSDRDGYVDLGIRLDNGSLVHTSPGNVDFLRHHSSKKQANNPTALDGHLSYPHLLEVGNIVTNNPMNDYSSGNLPACNGLIIRIDTPDNEQFGEVEVFWDNNTVGVYDSQWLLFAGPGRTASKKQASLFNCPSCGADLGNINAITIKVEGFISGFMDDDGNEIIADVVKADRLTGQANCSNCGTFLQDNVELY